MRASLILTATLGAALLAAPQRSSPSSRLPSMLADLDAAQTRPPAPIDRVVDEYRHGDAAAAVDEFARWDAKQVENAVASWAVLTAATTSGVTVAQARQIGALVMLETRAAVRQNAFASNSRTAALGTPPYYEAPYRLVKVLADGVRGQPPNRLEAADRVAVRTFCRNWFVLATSLWLSAWQCGKAADAADSGLALLGDDALLLLAAGSVAEVRAVRDQTTYSGACSPPSPMTSLHGSFTTSKQTLESAQRFLQRALAVNGSLAEARLRLGRVLYWQDRPADAVREFERAMSDVPADEREFVAYLAALFVGQVHEEAHRGPEAIRAYEQAIELNPRCQVAHLALGHLLISSGRVEEGWARARSASGRKVNGTDEDLDPWAMYRVGQLWRETRLGQEMDAWVQR